MVDAVVPDIVDTVIGPPEYIEQVFNKRRQNMDEASSPLLMARRRSGRARRCGPISGACLLSTP